MIRDQPRSRAASPQNTSADARPMIVSGHLARPAGPLAPGPATALPRPALSAAVTVHVTAPRRTSEGPAAQMVIS